MFNIATIRGELIMISRNEQIRLGSAAHIKRITVLIAICAVAAVALSLTGCANMTGGGAALNAEQMKAMVSDKNASAFCGVASGPWGRIITTYAVVDQKVIQDGGFMVDETCKVQFLNNKPQVIVNSGTTQVQQTPPPVQAPVQVFTPTIR